MKFTVSIKDNRQFRRLYAKGAQTAGSLLVLYVRKTKGKENRLGITVSGKLGNAVVRNKLRRRLREAYRTNEEAFQVGTSIVIVARGRAVGARYRDLEEAMLRGAKKAGILRVEESK